MANAAGHSLVHIQLIQLNITDLGVHYIAKECPNLEYMDLTDCIHTSDFSVKDILVRCPFIHTLILDRLGLGDGFGITEKMEPFMKAYGISLKCLGVAGCSIRHEHLRSLIAESPQILQWNFSYSQLGTRRIRQIKSILRSWFKVAVV
jgi:hypothetical protein